MVAASIEDIAFVDSCEQAVRRFIDNSEEVIGCVAWLTNPAIILSLARIRQCRIVVTADSVHNRASLGLHRVARQVGYARGRFRRLMHHKFIVRLVNGQPKEVLLGSYNFTRRSSQNLGESVVVIRDEHTAQQFASEADRLWSTARPIRARHARR